MRRKDIDHKRAAEALLAAMDRISGVFVKVDDESDELLGLTSSPIRLAPGTSSCSNPNCFAASSASGKLMPVALPPGRAKLTTRPRATGSSVTLNTIGMVAVSAFADHTGG